MAERTLKLLLSATVLILSVCVIQRFHYRFLSDCVSLPLLPLLLLYASAHTCVFFNFKMHQSINVKIKYVIHEMLLLA